jgi:hypothetical protein
MTDLCQLWIRVSVTGHLSVLYQLSVKVRQVEGIKNISLIIKYECLSDKQLEERI